MKSKTTGSYGKATTNVAHGVPIANTPLEFDETLDYKPQSKGSSSMDSQDMLSAIYKGMLYMMQHTSPIIAAGTSLGDYACSAFTFAGIANVSNVNSFVHHFNSTSWIIDTGYSDHMSSNKLLFSFLNLLSNPI